MSAKTLSRPSRRPVGDGDAAGAARRTAPSGRVALGEQHVAADQPARAGRGAASSVERVRRRRSAKNSVAASSVLVGHGAGDGTTLAPVVPGASCGRSSWPPGRATRFGGPEAVRAARRGERGRSTGRSTAARPRRTRRRGRRRCRPARPSRSATGRGRRRHPQPSRCAAAWPRCRRTPTIVVRARRRPPVRPRRAVRGGRGRRAGRCRRRRARPCPWPTRSSRSTPPAWWSPRPTGPRWSPCRRPQAFRAARAARGPTPAGAEGTDDAALVEAAGGRVVVVAGDPTTARSPSPDDLDWARRRVAGERLMTRRGSGQGFDVHRFSDDPAAPLVLGGVRVRGRAGPGRPQRRRRRRPRRRRRAARRGRARRHRPALPRHRPGRWPGADSLELLRDGGRDGPGGGLGARQRRLHRGVRGAEAGARAATRWRRGCPTPSARRSP